MNSLSSKTSILPQELLDISRELMSIRSLERLLHKIVEAAVELTGTESAGILLFDKASNQLRFVAATSFADQLFDIPVPVDSSIAGAAFSSGQPVIVPDVRTDSRYYKGVEQEIGFVARSLLAVPMQFRQRPIGVIEIENKRDDSAFTQADADVMVVLAAQAAVAIENTRLVEALRGQNKQTEALCQACLALTSTLNYDEVLDRILEQVSLVVPNDAVNVMIVENDGQTVRVFRGRGYERFGTADTLSATTLDITQTEGLRQMQQSGQPLVIPDVSHDEGWVYSRPEHTWIKSYVGVPLFAREQLVGFLNAMSAEAGSFSPIHGEWLQMFAIHAAIALDNARLYARAQQEIAERVRAEAELRRHRDHLEELVEERLAEIKRINAQLERHTAELEAQNAELDAFAHTVAHDLKNPLSILAGSTQLLAAHETLTAEELEQSAHHAARGALKAVAIVDNLLLLASTHKMSAEAQPLAMATIVAEALDRLANLIQEQHAQISLPPQWPVALGYGPWVEAIWVNYISNAIKYGGQPPRVELGFDEPANQQIMFWVRDNGRGLKPEEQARLFTPFERLRRTGSAGHGLGLSIVKRIVDKLGGQAGVESTPGQGSLFYFTLPAASSSDQPLPTSIKGQQPPPGLPNLEPELVAGLCQAALEGDVSQMQALIQQIQRQDANLGKMLNALAENYDYGRILELLRDTVTGQS